MTTETAGTVAVRGASFTIPSDPSALPQLRGSVCPACGARFAARRAICLGCGHRGLDETLLSPTGVVWTFTIVHQKPPGAIPEPPYAIAQVKLDDGPVVLSVITGAPLAGVRVGMPVEMTLFDTGRVDNGARVVACAFRPRGTP
jgi:uncharacterized OB-fold protein